MDPDYEWLLSHHPQNKNLQPRCDLAEKVGRSLLDKIETGALPYTIGVFGGWGSGKTTFLAMVAKYLHDYPNCQVVYFNSWKYAGFMEIVPSLIYKILHFGVKTSDRRRDEAAMRVLLSLGKNYSDLFGQWAKKWVGVDPVDLFNQAYKAGTIVADGSKIVRPELMEAYYGQVDKAQDCLVEVLGRVTTGKKAEGPIIVLIDELDRCDPDEAFEVIKQMRVLFAMRRLPLAFVVCANPEPIGLAIKHRYGLESATGDYEARRILEKFVDAYEDLADPVPLGDLTRAIWKKNSTAPMPWVIAIDAANVDEDLVFNDDTVHNANTFDAITTAVPYFSNLRVLHKSFNYVNERATWNRHLLWTIWHLEILNQIDPSFRQRIGLLATDITAVAARTYDKFAETRYVIEKGPAVKRMRFQTDKGRTLFAIYRSFFWVCAKSHLFYELKEGEDMQINERSKIFKQLMADYRKINFIISLSLLPFEKAPAFSDLTSVGAATNLPQLDTKVQGELFSQFGWLLANY